VRETKEQLDKKAKGPFLYDPFFRGPERIRTAVEAFAELCLTTRPQDLFEGHKSNKIFFRIF
jgi:hypothetical protein